MQKIWYQAGFLVITAIITPHGPCLHTTTVIIHTAAFALHSWIISRISFAAHVSWVFLIFLTVRINLKKKSSVIFPNKIFDLWRENIGKPLVFHLLYQGKHLGISSVSGLLDMASLCSDGQHGQKANCKSWVKKTIKIEFWILPDNYQTSCY